MASMIPSAKVLHDKIPPKMLMKITFTEGWLVIISKAAVIYLALAPPPTSKKLAGSAPNNLIISIVAIAKPAPFTKQPMFPFKATYYKSCLWAFSS